MDLRAGDVQHAEATADRIDQTGRPADEAVAIARIRNRARDRVHRETISVVVADVGPGDDEYLDAALEREDA